MSSIKTNTIPHGDAQIISDSLLKAKELLGLTGEEVYEITGVHPSKISRIKNNDQVLSDPKQLQIALHFLRLYRSLDSITGDDKTSSAWLKNKNTALGDTPLSLIKDIGGLIDVTAYLDSRRASV